MNKRQIDELFHYICELQETAIQLCDARPSALGGTFKRMKTLEEMQRYLAVENQISKLKKVFRKEVGWWKYYTSYIFKFTNAYNAYYYTRI